ncbi:MAG: HAD family hydrolase [Myxococcota bacterium]|nr:HAD family hydrolase [Myxococcota bacterium]
MSVFDELRAVTFDCWGTLLYDPDPMRAFGPRVEAVAAIAASAGKRVGVDEAQSALDTAWQRHIQLWEHGRASGAPEIAGWALEALGLHEPAAAADLATKLTEASLRSEVLPLDGAREALERIADAGLRRALVCDTGLSPGPVVREFLARAGLLDWLEVCVFSDEQGVPKPDPSVFHAALEHLETTPDEAAHVGDLRRTDVAGARSVGMRAIRIRWHHDDQSEHPEADAVVDSHDHLLEVLKV